MTHLHTYNFPAYAVTALEYGDFSGMEDLDIKALQDFIDSEVPANAAFDYAVESYFCSHPAFGLACDCIDLKVYA